MGTQDRLPDLSKASNILVLSSNWKVNALGESDFPPNIDGYRLQNVEECCVIFKGPFCDP